MEFEIVKETILLWEETLSDQMRKYIHYRSMKNFVLFYSEMPSEKEKSKIKILLSSYIEEVNAYNVNIDIDSGDDLAVKYLFAIAEYYKEHSNFMRFIKLQNVFIWGIPIDVILYFSNFLSSYFYLPIFTISLFLYYLFILIFKKSQGRVYGFFY